MTTLHVQEVAGHALVPRAELERLIALARQSEEVNLEVETQGQDAVSTQSIMELGQKSRAYGWLREEGDEYSRADLKISYR